MEMKVKKIGPKTNFSSLQLQGPGASYSVEKIRENNKIYYL